MIVRNVLLPLCTLLMGAMLLPAQNSLQRGSFTPSFGKLRDTLFVLDSTYLEIRLDRQMIYQHFRSGRVDSYTCSTGDPSIPDGIATRPGIFSIQGKAKKTMSQQFQVYLNYWMQFDGGIGFHGLDGRSYYKYLGRRPSSHGCVRISNETGQKLFKNVPSGTVVYVHSGSPARIVTFGDSSLANLRVIYDIDDSVFKSRLDAVTAGRWYDPALAGRLAIPPRKKIRKIAVGTVDPKLTVQYPIAIIELPVRPVVHRPQLSPAPPLPGYPSNGAVKDGQENSELSEHR